MEATEKDDPANTGVHLDSEKTVSPVAEALGVTYDARLRFFEPAADVSSSSNSEERKIISFLSYIEAIRNAPPQPYYNTARTAVKAQGSQKR